MALPLQDNVAFITGGGSGLGAETARRLARDGAIVAVNDLNKAAAEQVAAEVGGLAFAFDVTDSGAMDAAVDSCVAQLGRLNWISYPVIMLPSMVIMMFALFRLIRGLEQLTGLRQEELFHPPHRR